MGAGMKVVQISRQIFQAPDVVVGHRLTGEGSEMRLIGAGVQGIRRVCQEIRDALLTSSFRNAAMSASSRALTAPPRDYGRKLKNNWRL